jgi:hypothetical protein
MSKVIFYFLFLFLSVAEIDIAAQGIHAHHEVARDTNSLSHFFEKGRFYGHARTYLSGTVNQGDLTDYHAVGIGAGIGYETPIFLKHFQVGLSGFFMFNLLSSDLSKVDPKTKQPNRYEVGLFDIEQPEDHEDLDRLEELYIKTYLSKKTFVKIGRQIPNSPFVNPQDGRMRPTLTEGAVLEIQEWKNLKLQAEYLWRVSPRSTVRWFSVGESVGVYPVGVNLEGNPSMYKNNIESKGIGIVGAKYNLKRWNIEVWDNYFHNVLNTLQLKMEWKSEVIRNKNWLVGGQYIQQNNSGNGGNEEIEKSYLNTNKGSSVISARIGRQSEKFDWFLNGTRITAKGRYLMPREWGREPFYTFLPRERNEGLGDLSAVSLNAFFKPKKGIKVELSGGYYHLPDVKNFELNKYGMPTYTQVNFGLTYQFDHYLKGLNALLLVVRKDEIGNTYENDRYVFNKVNLTHLNLIFNYHY